MTPKLGERLQQILGITSELLVQRNAGIRMTKILCRILKLISEINKDVLYTSLMGTYIDYVMYAIIYVYGPCKSFHNLHSFAGEKPIPLFLFLCFCPL